MSPIKYTLHLLKHKKLSENGKRDFRVLLIACVLNLSFALEKLCKIAERKFFGA